FQAEDGIRDFHVTGVQTCALPISSVFSNGQWANFTLDNAAGAQKIVINVDASATNGDVNFTAGNIDANTFKNLSDRIVWNFYNRSEERRVGKERKSMWSSDLSKKR